jgi:hypothetical protein
MSRSNRKQEGAPRRREAPYQEIAQRAFEIYCSSGYEEGCADKHWIQAEQELMEGKDSSSQRQEAEENQ